MRIDQEKLRAINELKAPENKKDLQRLLGLVNYIRKCIPKLGEIVRPLCDLLKKNIEFQWLEIHNKALNTITNGINQNMTLVSFDPTKERMPL